MDIKQRVIKLYFKAYKDPNKTVSEITNEVAQQTNISPEMVKYYIGGSRPYASEELGLPPESLDLNRFRRVINGQIYILENHR